MSPTTSAADSCSSNEPSSGIAIIGAGIAGLTLALQISKSSPSLPIRIYESRQKSAGPTLGGAMMLSPNSLSLFHTLGAYPSIAAASYPFSNVYYKDASEETTDAYPMGDEMRYGYPALRIYRRDLYAILVRLCKEATQAGGKIDILYDSKFSSVVSEGVDDGGVRFSLADGREERAALLVAADGIHSAVRRYVAPSTELVFINLAAVAYAIPTAQLRIPSSPAYQFPVTITTSRGNFVLAPQGPLGDEMLAGTQFLMAEQGGRDGWDVLARDKAKLKDMLRTKILSESDDDNGGAFPDIVRSAVDGDIRDDSMYVWPFYKLPPLPRWTSADGTVVLIGDAAHALPPTTGQGAGMAVEDAVTLGRMIGASFPDYGDSKKKRVAWTDAVAWWESARKKRIEALIHLTTLLNNKRLPPAKQALLPPGQVWLGADPGQMDWLYDPRVEEEVEAWIAGQVKL